MRATSFISEHSAEYVLVKDIVSTLSNDFDSVIPIYHWATREGASIARQCMSDLQVRVLAAYARRPKITHPDQEWLIMKVNSQLFEAARVGQNFGCPVLAGIPLVTNLFSFKLDVPCSWFRINDGGSECELRLLVTGEIIPQDESCSAEGPLTNSTLINIAQKDTRAVPWIEAVEVMSLVKRAGQQGGFYFAGYRPFFIIIPVCMEQSSNKSLHKVKGDVHL